MIRRVALAMAILFGTLATVTLVPVVSAGAADPPMVGSYQVYGTLVYNLGSSPFGLILERDHALDTFVLGRYFGGGNWSVWKHVVTIRFPGVSVPPAECENFGQPYPCYTTETLVGVKTPTGIASPLAGGTVTNNLGTFPLPSGAFYAVRTGGVPRGKS
jgi:hypothetical protein